MAKRAAAARKMKNLRQTRKSSTSSTEELKGDKSNQLSIRRDIFRDPFFTENWEDLFNVPSSFDEILNKSRQVAKNVMRNAEKNVKNIDTSHPGSYTTKSFYRSSHSGPGKEARREVVSQETTTNVDAKGHKYTERWKNHEKNNMKKTVHSKMIDDRGVKEMRKHDLSTGEEYVHTDYRKLNEKEYNNFNNEFERGIRSSQMSMPSISPPSLFRGLGWDPFSHFGHFADRFGLPSMDRNLMDLNFPRLDYDTASRAATDTSETPKRLESRRSGQMIRNK